MKITRFLYLIVLPWFAAPIAVAEDTAHSTALPSEGQSVARYRFGDVSFKSYISELRTPSGRNILRDAPADHLHHHALMYAIRVGGYNFWEESTANSGKQITIRNRRIGDNTIELEIDWKAPDETTLLQEVRKINLVQAEDGITLLDWQSILRAVNDTVLGDEGSGHYHGLGMRFAAEMDKRGRFFNNTGKNDGEIVRGDERLTQCQWMAYTATLEGKPVTVAMFNHPSNPIPMTVFTMGDGGGAFAYMSATTNFYRKPMPMISGGMFAVKYRIAVWDGETVPEAVERAYNDYCDKQERT